MSDPILDLLAAPPSPALSVDEHAVYAGGRRRLRRRTLRRTGMGVMGVVGAAAIAFGALGAGVDNDALPAGPSPSAGSGFPHEMTTLLKDRFAIQVVGGEGATSAHLYGLVDGRPEELSQIEARPDAVHVGLASAEDGIMVGIAPVRARSTYFLASAQQGAHSTTLVAIPGTAYQGIVVDFEKPLDEDASIGALWVDDQGQVHDDDGSKAPSVTIPGTADHAFFTNGSQKVGVVEPDGWYVTDIPSEGLATVQTQFQQIGVWRTRAVVRVPLNSPQAFSLAWNGATSDPEGGIVSMGNSPWAMVVGTVDGRAKLTSVMYQDDSGEQHHSAVK